MEGSYIRLYRSMLEWGWWHDINTCRLFTYMLLKANWKDGNFKGATVPRGSFVSSIKRLSEETDLTPNEVRTAIKNLEKARAINKQSTNKYTVYTLVGYDMYQGDSQAEPSQTTSSPQTINKLLTTIEERKKERREENKKEAPKGAKKKAQPVYYPDDGVLNQAFSDYVAMRKEIKKTMTDRAVTLAMNKLKSLSQVCGGDGMDHDMAVRILEQSILNSWQGLFPLKESENGRTGSNTGTYDKGFNGRLLEAGYEPEYKEYPFAD